MESGEMPSKSAANAALTTAAFEAVRAPRRAHPAAVVWALTFLVSGLFWPTLAALWGVWMHVADYQYGFLAAGIALWLLFKESNRIDAADVKPEMRILPALAVTLVVWMVAYRAHSDMLQQVLFPAVLLLSVYASLGFVAARTVAFPIAYFYFAMPLWDHFVPVLQWMTTQAAENLLALLNVPTQVDGHQVTIPAGKFSIVEGCSGKRYFIIGLSFAALLGWLQGVRRGRFILLLAIAALIAILVNWVRVVIVIYAGHVSDMQHYLVAVEHKTLGYALFLPMLWVIAWVGRRLAMPHEAPEPTHANLSWHDVARSLAGPSLLILGSLVWLTAASRSVDASVAVGVFPLRVGEWHGPLPASREWEPRFAGASDERRASYADAQGRIDIYVNAYGQQSDGQELVYHSNSLSPAPSWIPVRTWSSSGLRIWIATHPQHGRWVFAQTYVVGGHATPSALQAQFLYGWSALGTPDMSGVVGLATRCQNDCAEEAVRIEHLWLGNKDELVRMVPSGEERSKGSE